jgi:hypothetical protein
LEEQRIKITLVLPNKLFWFICRKEQNRQDSVEKVANEDGLETLTGYLLDTEGCPSPRVGHASLTLGNAFIVFGGDTKIEETDELDDNLYLLNTTTLKWTVANPVGPKPSGRYGHSISTIGSKVYIFGGQLDDYFFDDLVCYDLTTLRSQNSQWELIKPTSASPPPRTNHTVVTFQEKLYLFGGTDGKLWYSDTWCYDPQLNSWTLLECSGFIPAPCEGHSATIVGDIMYVFGGRSSQGKDLNTLSALKLTTRKWFTFQNLGPGPSPRSGHSMTAFGGYKVLVMGGESPDVVSTEEESEDKNHTVFVLDTSRINYPPDTHSPPPQQQPMGPRSPSNNGSYQSKPNSPPPNTLPPRTSFESERSREAIAAARSTSPMDRTGFATPAEQPVVNNKSIDEHLRSPSGMSELTPGVGYERVDVGPSDNYDETDGGDGMSATTYESAENDTQEEASTYSPVHLDDGSKKSLETPTLNHRDSTDTMTERNKQGADLRTKTPDVSNIPGAWQPEGSQPVDVDDGDDDVPPGLNKDLPSSSPPPSADTTREMSSSPHIKREDSLDERYYGNGSVAAGVAGGVAAAAAAGGIMSRKDSDSQEITPTRGSFDQEATLDSGDKEINSVQQALERLKASNSWYETELAAARDAGYVPSSRPPVDVLKLRRVSQRLTHDTADTLSEREILITALNELKEELNSVQANVKMQAEAASERISKAEKARDAALEENERLKGGLGGGEDSARGMETVGSEQSVIISGLESKVKELENKLSHANKTKALLLGGAVSSTDDGTREIQEDDEEGTRGDVTYQKFDELRSNNVSLEKQLRAQTDKLVLAEHEVSQMRSQLEELQTRSTDLENTAEDKVQALTAITASLRAAEDRASEANRQLSEHQSTRAELEERVRQLEREAEEHQQRIETSQRDLDEHKGLLEHANAQNEHASLALTNHIEKIVTMWGASKSFNRNKGMSKRQSTRSMSEDGDTTLGDEEVGEPDDPRYVELQKKLNDVTQLHETHRAAADKASDDLSAALAEISQLKQQLATSDGSRSGTEEELGRAMEQVKSVRAELETNQMTLDDMTKRYAELETRLTDSDESHEQRVQENERKLQELDQEHKARYAELEEDYEKSLQYFKNTETALSRTREELAKYKDMSNKLKSELDDLKLRAQEDEEDADRERGMSSPSMGSKYSTKNFDLQLRDLRAQIIILQEERDDLRENILDLKKKGINTKHDLEEAQKQVQELSQENDNLRSKLQHVENGNGL